MFDKNLLVTGATGFVGRALCERMRDDDWCLRGGVRYGQHSASLSDGVEWVSIESIGPHTDWTAALEGIDAVIHLSARVHVMNDTVSDPIAEFRSVNVAGTERLARMAAKSGVRRLVFLSSIKVNGEGAEKPYSEEDAPKPLDPYGVSKWEAENILWRVAAETGLEVVIIRPPLVYGPGVKANFLRMLQSVRQGVPLPFAGISNRRSLIYLGNLIDVIITCVRHPAAAGQTFLVSDGDDVSTPELFRRTGEALGQPARLFPFPPSLLLLAGRLCGKTAAVERLLGSLVVDSSKIRRELGWTPPFTMDEGLKATADWFKHEKSL